MSTITSRRRPTLVTMATAYADQSEGGEEFVIPEDFTSLDDAALAQLHVTAQEHFDTIYGDGQDLADGDITILAGLTEGIEALANELSAREEAARVRSEEAAALAARVRPAETQLSADTDEPGDDDEDKSDEDTEPEEEPATEDEGAAETVVASGRTAATRIPLSSVRNRASRRPAVDDAPGERRSTGTIADVMVASGEGLGVAVNTGIDWDAAGKMLDTRLKGFNEKAYLAASRRGNHLTEKHSLLSINRPMPPELTVDANGKNLQEVLDRAGDESRLPGGSLVAAGGWCAPSQVLYDLVGEVESRDGLLSIPEIGVPRGGISFTTGIDFRDLYAQVAANSFSFTEEQDVDGEYAAPTVSPWAATTSVSIGAYRGLPTGEVLQATTAGTTGETAPASPNLFGSVTDGTVVWRRVGQAEPNVEGDKPCFRIECPPFEEYRLDVDGLCITAGILQSRGYPEVQGRTIRGALVAHDHLMNGKMIAQMAAGSTQITLPATQAGTAAPVLTAIELQVEHYKASRRMSRNTTLEAVFPYWILGAIRSDLSRRIGVDSFLSVSDAQILTWFRDRGVNPQFVYNWQQVDVQTEAQFTEWPSVVSFLLYSAGTWIRGASDIITLDTLYDSVLLAQNDFTALFTEEGWFVAKRGQDSRLVTTSITADGATHIGINIAHNGTATP